MNPLLLAAVWMLTTLDASLMGYRLSMGRHARLDKTGYHRALAIRGAVLVQPALAAVVALAWFLAEQGGPATQDAYDLAMQRFVVIGGAYAVVILGTWSTYLLPSLAARSAASVIVFGPLTLLRPVIVVVTVAAALWQNASAPLVATALLVAVPGVAIEPVLDARIAAAMVRAEPEGRTLPLGG